MKNDQETTELIFKNKFNLTESLKTKFKAQELDRMNQLLLFEYIYYNSL
jgi:hypothetical protein